MKQNKGIGTIATVVVVIVVIAIVAGVGAWYFMGGEEEEPTNGEPTNGNGEPAPDSIKIGATVPKTGANAPAASYFGPLYTEWAKMVNEKYGGLYIEEYDQKIPIEMVIYDSKSDPATAAKYYERLIVQDDVDILFGPWGDPMVLSVNQLAEKYEVPMLIGCGATPEIYKKPNKWCFNTQEVLPKWFERYIELMEHEGLESIGLIYAEDPYATKVLEGLRCYVEESDTVKITIEGHLTPQETYNWGPIIDRIKQEDPDVVLMVSVIPPAHLSVWKQMKEKDYEPKLYCPVPLECPGPVWGREEMEGFTTATFYVPEEPYEGVYGKEFAHELFERAEIEVDLYLEAVASMYMAEEMVKLGVESAGSLDKEKLREAFADLDFESWCGRSNVRDYTMELGPPTNKIYELSNVSTVQWIVIQMQDGKWKTLWPEEIKTGELIYPMQETR